MFPKVTQYIFTKLNVAWCYLFFFFRFSPLVLWVGPWVFENHIFPESTLIVSLVFSVRPLCVLVPSLHACFSVPGSYGSYLAASH